jgi:ATP diphosphatase
MARLRDPDTGCPWDASQDFATILPYTIEETYEVVDAIAREDYAHLGEELGDLLFQIVFYSELAAEQNLFNLHDVIHGLVNKLIVRHPHVFPEGTLASTRKPGSVPDTTEIKNAWENLKRKEREDRGNTGRLSDVPLALPALSRAEKLQKRAARHGFDWQKIQQVVEKIDEELLELKEAMAATDAVLLEEELGDLIFCCVNFARHAGLDAESVLRKANNKFENRFTAMEKRSADQNLDFDQLPAQEKNELWEAVKRQEKC